MFEPACVRPLPCVGAFILVAGALGGCAARPATTEVAVVDESPVLFVEPVSIGDLGPAFDWHAGGFAFGAGDALGEQLARVYIASLEGRDVMFARPSTERAFRD